jgi:hypothetical protein
MVQGAGRHSSDVMLGILVNCFVRVVTVETLSPFKNHWVYGLSPTSGILNAKKNWKMDLFPSSGERRETPIMLGPLERANLQSTGPVTKIISF